MDFEFGYDFGKIYKSFLLYDYNWILVWIICVFFGFYLMDMLNIKIVKNLRKKGGKVISFYGLLKIFYNIIYVIYWFLKKFLFVSFLYDKWDNLENKMYIVNKCVLVMIGWGIVYDVEGVFYINW